ncbi:MAG: integration host factor subunit beta [Bacteroidales bacterium]|nr:integration host factor subunit beta [Bacteroidales bacterium]
MEAKIEKSVEKRLLFSKIYYICTALESSGSPFQGVPPQEVYKPIITNKMTKAEVVSEIAAKTGLEKTVVLATVETFMDVVKDNMISGQNVYLRGFGSFIIKTRAKKTGRNISKNTSIEIPAHNIPAFKPAKTFLTSVKKNVKA